MRVRVSYLNTNFLIHALLLLLDLLFELLYGRAIWGGAVRLEDLDIPGGSD